MAGIRDNKVVLITQKTRLESLVRRYNNEGQVRFYVERRGGDFEDYRAEHETYRAALSVAVDQLGAYGRVQVVDREHLPNFVFGEKDVVAVLGRDGLAANTLKYLKTQPLIGVNPDPGRWDGILVPFRPEDLGRIVPEVFRGTRQLKSVTFAEATLNDGQSICAVNDLFIGCRTHASARYRIAAGGGAEEQSSSGIIVSTGLGSTGWMKSVLAGVRGISSFYGGFAAPTLPNDLKWDSRRLYYMVREPYPSGSTGADIVFGRIEAGSPITISSLMAENGVIFSDGMENDYIEFNSGVVATVGVSSRKGLLVT